MTHSSDSVPSSVGESEADANYQVFKDCLSSCILEKYSIGLPKKMTKRTRKGIKNTQSPSIQNVSENEKIDASELADFIEVTPDFLPKRISRSIISEIG